MLMEINFDMIRFRLQGRTPAKTQDRLVGKKIARAKTNNDRLWLKEVESGPDPVYYGVGAFLNRVCYRRHRIKSLLHL